ncbi:MAG: class I SAM-dependent methyltransferase [Myxococcales bacterium]|nr:class I SAM-dependent methyltransferase [Myxococcales bacterium]
MTRLRYQPFDWYETPRYYDIVYDGDSAAEVQFLVDVYAAHGAGSRGGGAHGRGGRARRTRPRVLEPACGTGRHFPGLVARGFTCVGFDIEEGMLAMARARCPEATLTRQSMQTFRVRGHFDLAFNLLSSFKHILDPEGATSHLRRIADALHPGGLYILGLHESEYDLPHRKRERWQGHRDDTHVTVNLQVWPANPTTRLEHVRSRLIVEQGGERRGYESHWDFRTYDDHEIRSLIAEEPRLRLEAVYGFEHRVDRPHELGGERLDHVLVLRRG